MPTTEYGVDQFFQNAGTSPKTVYDVAGTLGWSPHNMCLNSQTFNVANWSAAVTVSLTVDATAAPDGTVTAEKLAALGSGASFHSMPYSPLIGIIVGEAYTFSVYAKAAEHSWLGLEINNTNVNISYFDLTNGVVGTRAGIHTASSITAVGNGWYRCSVTYLPSASAGPTIHFVGANNGGSFATSIGFGLYIWGAQLNRGTVPTAYLPTTTAARYGLALDYDPVTHAARGLLCEPAATNVFKWSNDFTNVLWATTSTITVTANATAAPDGTATADKLTEATTTADHTVYQAITPLVGAGRLSVFAKAGERGYIVLLDNDGMKADGFNLIAGTSFVVSGITTTGAAQIQAVGNGWYRCSIPVNSGAAYPAFQIMRGTSAGDNSYTGDGVSGLYVWGAQIETGTVATSLIPTFAASATRTANAYNFTSASINHGATAGSWWADVQMLYNASGTRIVDELPNSVPLYSGSLVAISLFDGTVLIKNVASTLGLHKISSAFQVGDRAITADGLAVVTDAGATNNLLAPTTIYLGGSALHMTGYIRKLRYVPRRKTNAELVTETT